MLITISNLDPANTHTCEVNLRGIRSAKVTSTKLRTSGGDLNAHNSLSQPARLAPTTPATPRLAGGTLQVTLPAASLQSISIELS
jgi:alpha-N-arabinofuranosidase